MMDMGPRELRRDCDAIQIPNGNQVTARAGTEVSIMHAFGDTYTVRTAAGYLLRIDAVDADALGEEATTPAPAEAAATASGPVEEAALWTVLRTVYDPEIPSNIVDLGLIYRVEVQPVLATEPAGGADVSVTMTLTAPGCGMGQVLQDDVQRKLARHPGVRSVQLELVFDPPWDQTMMSESARLTLGMM